tara:strand:+ start:548 stop:688 length:141 start_codon:yes stop_codon:yes gene_type:complete
MPERKYRSNEEAAKFAPFVRRDTEINHARRKPQHRGTTSSYSFFLK